MTAPNARLRRVSNQRRPPVPESATRRREFWSGIFDGAAGRGRRVDRELGTRFVRDPRGFHTLYIYADAGGSLAVRNTPAFTTSAKRGGYGAQQLRGGGAMTQKSWRACFAQAWAQLFTGVSTNRIRRSRPAHSDRARRRAAVALSFSFTLTLVYVPCGLRVTARPLCDGRLSRGALARPLDTTRTPFLARSVHTRTASSHTHATERRSRAAECKMQSLLSSR